MPSYTELNPVFGGNDGNHDSRRKSRKWMPAVLTAGHRPGPIRSFGWPRAPGARTEPGGSTDPVRTGSQRCAHAGRNDRDRRGGHAAYARLPRTDLHDQGQDAERGGPPPRCAWHRCRALLGERAAAAYRLRAGLSGGQAR